MSRQIICRKLGKSREVASGRTAMELLGRGFNRKVSGAVEGLLNRTVGQKATVLSGLRDSHTHPAIQGIMIEATNCIFIGESTDKKAVLAKVEERAKEQKNVFGWGFAHGSGITAEDLDRIAEKHGCEYILLVDTSFHGGMANTNLLKELKRRESSKPMRGSMKENGTVLEDYNFAAVAIVEEQFKDEAVDATEKWLIKRINEGTTLVDEKLVMTITEAYVLRDAVKRVKDRYGINPIGSVCLSHELFLSNPELLGVLREITPDVRIKWVNDAGTRDATLQNLTFADGSKGNPHTIPIRGEEAEAYARKLLEQGVSHLEWHASGDGTMKILLDMAPIFLEAGIGLGFSHVNVVEVVDLRRASEFGIPLAVQPNFNTEYWRPEYASVLGDLKEEMNLLRVMLELYRGKKELVTFGTDGLPQSMLFAMLCAMNGANPRQTIGDFETAHRHSVDESTIMVLGEEGTKMFEQRVDMGAVVSAGWDSTLDTLHNSVLLVASKDRVLYTKE